MNLNKNMNAIITLNFLTNMSKSASGAQSDARPTNDQEVASSISAWCGNILS